MCYDSQISVHTLFLGLNGSVDMTITTYSKPMKVSFKNTYGRLLSFCCPTLSARNFLRPVIVTAVFSRTDVHGCVWRLDSASPEQLLVCVFYDRYGAMPWPCLPTSSVSTCERRTQTNTGCHCVKMSLSYRSSLSLSPFPLGHCFFGPCSFYSFFVSHQFLLMFFFSKGYLRALKCNDL